MARFRGYLDLAAELQHPGETLTVTTTSGGTPDDWESVKQTLADRFGELAEYAKDVGVMIGAEPHVGAALRRPEEALWLLEQVDSPALTIHFDISHFNVQGMDMEPVVAQLAPHSLHTHVKDERGIAPHHEFLIPGEGEMDYLRYLRAMDRAGYDGHIVVEISIMVQARPTTTPWPRLHSRTGSCPRRLRRRGLSGHRRQEGETANRQGRVMGGGRRELREGWRHKMTKNDKGDKDDETRAGVRRAKASKASKMIGVRRRVVTTSSGRLAGCPSH